MNEGGEYDRSPEVRRQWWMSGVRTWQRHLMRLFGSQSGGKRIQKKAFKEWRSN